MKQSLYSHNLKAYEAVKAHYADGHCKACVVHATGTGKSYIISALAEDYERVLLVAPNDYVLEQVRKNAGKNIRYMTYAKLMTDAKKGKTPVNRYDLIVLDEYHRAGASQWSEGVQSIMGANPSALIFGTTATDVRYLDDRRNMSQELFDGHVVSTLAVGEAWARKILQSPVYVCALEDFGETEQAYRERIETSALKEEERGKMLGDLSQARKDWENVGGVPSIIRKHLSNDVRRIIVFCPDVNSTKRYRVLVQKWFANAGIPLERIYVIESTRKASVNMKEMELFQEEGEGGVKVMISVNMLNEGIHVPHVDAVIMLRGTASGNIYLQQMGRCMHAGSTGRRPVVLDLANNITSAFTASSVLYERQDYERAIKELLEEQEDAEPGEPIEVIDYLMDVRELLAKMDERMAYCDRWNVWDRYYEQAKKFYEEHGRFPKHSEALNLRSWFKKWVRCYRESEPERMKKLRDIGYTPPEYNKDSWWNARYEEAKRFYEEHGHFPSFEENRRISSWAFRWMKANSDEDKQKAKMLCDIGWKSSGLRQWKDYYNEAKTFFDENGRFPSKDENERLNKWVSEWFVKSSRKHPDKAMLLREIGYTKTHHRIQSWEESYRQAKEHFDRTGHFPTAKENRKLRHWAATYVRRYQDKSPDKIQLLYEIGFENTRSWDDNYRRAKVLFEKNGHFPTKSENFNLWSWAIRWKRKYEHQDPKRMKMLRDIGFRALTKT